MTKEQVLEKIRDTIKKSYRKNPTIGVDSLSLLLKIPVTDLLPLLYKLEFEGHIQIHDNTKSGKKHVGGTANGEISLL